MFRTTLAAVVVTIGLSATQVAAASIADRFSSFWVFGDSLSDNGNLFAQSGGFPPAPYFQGRFSDGPVWNEGALAQFAPGASGNLAFGAARAVPNPAEDSIPDLPGQIAIFDSLRPVLSVGDRALASVFFGANDMFATIGAAATASAPASVPGIIAGGITATIGSIAAGVDALSARGIDQFVLWNLPDLGSTPRLQAGGAGLAGLGTQVTVAYNSAFNAMVADLRRAGLTIHTVDTFALITAATADPGAFGLTNVTEACIAVEPNQLLDPAFTPPTVCGSPSSFLYWDNLHPSSTGHAALADAFEAAVIPLPASVLLLLAGLGGFVALRRRRAA